MNWALGRLKGCDGGGKHKALWLLSSYQYQSSITNYFNLKALFDSTEPFLHGNISTWKLTDLKLIIFPILQRNISPWKLTDSKFHTSTDPSETSERSLIIISLNTNPSEKKKFWKLILLSLSERVLQRNMFIWKLTDP